MLRKIYSGHRAEIKAGKNGLGQHFLTMHGGGLNLKDDYTFENNVMKHFNLQ